MTEEVVQPSLLDSLPAPAHHYDAWVMAGGRLFRAHGSVLACHSPYLRAAAAIGCDGAGETRLLLPHVPAQGFAAILAYMYTGRLPITPATLYEVFIIHLTYFDLNKSIRKSQSNFE